MTYEPLRAARHEDLTAHGLRHHLTWWGERTETPIVLLHGYRDCGASWQFLVDSVPREWCLVAPDWRGFGRSEWAPGGYWFPDYLADLDALLDVLVPHCQARIVAHSMGANIAMLYGGIRPKRLAWLANLEGLGLLRTAPQEAPARYAQWLDELRQPARERRFRSVEELKTLLLARNPRLTPERADFLARAWTTPAIRGATGDAARGSADDEVALRFDPRHRLVNPVLYRREEAEACWARFEAPMLLITGEHSEQRSKHLRSASDEELRSLFRDLRRIVTLPGVGHMMHHEDPAAVARHIVAFDAECAAPRKLLQG